MSSSRIAGNRRLSHASLLILVFALTLLLGAASVRAQNLPVGNSPLPVFTSPIDVTGAILRIAISVADPDTKKRVDTPPPAELFSFTSREIFEKPLSTMADERWNLIPDKNTGRTQRQMACDSIDAQVAAINQKLPDNVRLVVFCNLATQGTMHAQQKGAILNLAYQLTNNEITVRVNTPGTCKPEAGKRFCPDDPQATITFAAQVVSSVGAKSLCSMSATDGTQVVLSPTFRGDTHIASVGLDLVRLLMPNNAFPMAEEALKSVQKQVPLPHVAFFNAMSSNPACSGKLPGAGNLLRVLPTLETEIDLRIRRIIMRATHPGINPPQVGAPSATAPPAFPKSFTRPEISLSQPFVQAGNSIQVSGKNFPRSVNLSKSLPVTFQHEGYANNSSLPACGDGRTELQVGSNVQIVRADATGRCPGKFELTNLTPNTTYQLRARDCDLITCSAWSAPVRVTTARADATPGQVTLTLDSGTRPHQPNRPWDKRPRGSGQLGTVSTDANGTFTATVTIPAGTPAGTHTIHAVAGTAETSENFQVSAAPGTGTGPAPGTRRGTMMMVFARPGQKGCPNNPIASTGINDTFMLAGSGFGPGTITIRLDTATGAVLGSAAVQADGNFCGQMRSTGKPGKYTLIAVQNGAVVSQLPTQFVRSGGVN